MSFKLKYLFRGEYKDGTKFCQNAEDVSATDPKRSAFFDVRHEDVKRFSLVGGGFLLKDSFTVDLTDGHFETNGTPFFMHDREMPLADIKLIFHRKHTHHFNMAGGSPKELDHLCDYCIGWEAKDPEGNAISRILEVR